MSVALYLSIKEVLHHRLRFLLIAMIVALITTLVLFIAALSEGLGSGNIEYIDKLNADLLVYQENADLTIAASRLGRSKMTQIRRVEGVAAVGQIAVTTSSIAAEEGREAVDISLVGVEPGAPGEPPAYQGRPLGRNRANEAIVDKRVVDRTGLQVGDTLVLKSVQGTEEEYFDLTVVGISDGRGFFLLPSVFVPYLTWDRVRPKASNGASNGESNGESNGQSNGQSEFISNLVAVQLQNPAEWKGMAARLEQQVSGIEAVDRKTAYEATPGYAEQQGTLDTQRYFTFFIGILVIGGFFQIQTLQKVAQIGMLKAIGASTWTIALSSMSQIVLINALGVAIGAVGSLLLSLTFPPTLPIIFSGDSVLSAVAALLFIGPLGGLVSVWVLLRVEPLTALGLAQ